MAATEGADRESGSLRNAQTKEETLAPHPEARRGAELEHRMTLWQAIKMYPNAVGWSVLLSSTLIMEGYDLALVGNLYASPMFNRKYGFFDEAANKYVISAAWQSGISNGARAGEIFGLIVAGWTADRYGYKKTTMGALIFLMGCIFVLFFAPNIETLVAGCVLCGLPWGVFQSVTPAYASEVAPTILRPYLTTFINMCWVVGQFASAGVNRATVNRNDEWAYRIPYAVQWVWPIPILAGLFFAPESPWWSIRHNNREAAKRSLIRLTARNQPGFNVDETLALMEHTNEMERRVKEGVRYRDCFRGIDLRRTEIVVGIWLVQTLGGQNIMGYFTYFLTQAGMDASNSFSLSMANSALGIVGTALSWLLMTRIGRRKIHFTGLCCQLVILFIVGCLSFAKTRASVWAIGGLLILFTFVYDMGVGPVTYSLVSELSSTRLKAKTIVLARAAYNASNIFVNVMTNYQLSSAAWNWGARTAFFWAGTCFLSCVWVYFRLPEPKDRTYAELDVLFEQRVSARKFARTKVDPYSHEISGDEKRFSTGTAEEHEMRRRA